MTKQEIKELMFTQVEVWTDDHEDEAIGELQGYDGDGCYLVDGSWFDHIRPIKPKKSIPMTAETCPRRPVLKSNIWAKGVEVYPNITAEGLVWISFFDHSIIKRSWTELAEASRGWTQGDGSPWTVEAEL